MGESYMYQRLPYSRAEEEGEEEEEDERHGSVRESVGGQMVKYCMNMQVDAQPWLMSV